MHLLVSQKWAEREMICVMVDSWPHALVWHRNVVYVRIKLSVSMKTIVAKVSTVYRQKHDVDVNVCAMLLSKCGYSSLMHLPYWYVICGWFVLQER